MVGTDFPGGRTVRNAPLTRAKRCLGSGASPPERPSTDSLRNAPQPGQRPGPAAQGARRARLMAARRRPLDSGGLDGEGDSKRHRRTERVTGSLYTNSNFPQHFAEEIRSKGNYPHARYAYHMTANRRLLGVLAVPHEVLARLPVQALRVRLVRAFYRLGRAGAGVPRGAVRRRWICRRIESLRRAGDQQAKRRGARQTFDLHLQSHLIVIARPSAQRRL